MDKSIAAKQICVIAFSFFIFGCTASSQTSKSIKIEATRDTCYVLVDSADREIEIVENTLQDTVVFGATILSPNYIGPFDYLLLSKKKDAVLYSETPKYLWPKTLFFCMTLYNKRQTHGHILVKYK